MTAFEFFKQQLDKSIADGRMPPAIGFTDLRIPKDASWGGIWGSEVSEISDLAQMIKQGIIIKDVLTPSQAQGLDETELYMLTTKGRILFYKHFYGVI